MTELLERHRTVLLMLARDASLHVDRLSTDGIAAAAELVQLGVVEYSRESELDQCLCLTEAGSVLVEALQANPLLARIAESVIEL